MPARRLGHCGMVDLRSRAVPRKRRRTPHFSGCAFSGRTTVDLGRSEGNPLTLPYRTLVVARYTGAAPNLAAWRLAGTGIPKTGATFVAENGEVRATVGQAGGVMLLVR